ncbi:MAG: alpha-L-fucosidase, partial [Candidatus Solibacter sp.]
MRRRDLLRTCAAAPLALAAGRRAFAQNRFQPTWESIDARPSPEWYTDSKFGIFIHWGVYSVPAYAPVKSKGETMYAEWYWNSLNKANSSTRKFHDKNYGANFPYADFAPMFKAEFYNPDHWADVFERSGAKYV